MAQGSYEQNKQSKLWSVRFRWIVDGKEIQKRLSGFRTKKEAQAAYVDFVAQHPKPIQEGKPLLFEQLYAAYLDNAKTRLKKSNLYDLTLKIEKQVLPYFQGKPVSQIKPIDILQWQNSKSEYSYNYRCKLRDCLSAVLKFGEQYYEIPNVLHKVERPRNLEKAKEMQIWTLEEFKKFSAVIDRLDYKAYFTFLYMTGCRKGEAQALSWDDFNFSDKTVYIHKTLTRKVDDKPWEVLNSPKNVSSIRHVALSDSLVALLLEYKEWQKSNCDDILFAFGGSEPLKDTNLDRAKKEYCKKSGVKLIRTHDLRHSHASYLISQGVSIVAIARRLGHKDIEQTLNTYSHLMPSDEKQILDKLNFPID